MPKVTFNGDTYDCAVAYRGSDYIHLIDENGVMIAAFDGVANFAVFSISDGSWTTPSPANCFLAVYEEDGRITRGSRIANSATLRAANWTNDSQVVTVSGMTMTRNVVVSPDPVNFVQYCEAGVYCSAQGTGSLTFKCSYTPDEDIKVNILVIGG